MNNPRSLEGFGADYSAGLGAAMGGGGALKYVMLGSSGMSRISKSWLTVTKVKSRSRRELMIRGTDWMLVRWMSWRRMIEPSLV